MALTVDFHRFSKRENSTKRPPDTGDSFQCELKAECGILNPAIILLLDDIAPPLYNYVYIPAFERYYFVTDWTWNAGLWTASLQVDALASWKTAIGNSYQYVLRSQFTYDGDILDTTYPTKGGADMYASMVTGNPFSVVLSYGRYVVGIINANAGDFGAVSYYVFNSSEFSNLCSALMADPGYLGINIDELSPEMQKALVNPYQYITSCMWFPFDVAEGDPVSDINFGWWTLAGTACHKLFINVNTFTAAVSVPKHPNYLDRGGYLNLEPFAKYELDYRPWGQIALDSTLLYDTFDLELKINVDLVTGQGMLTISKSATSGDMMTVHTAQVGVPIQLAQITRDYLSMYSGMAQSTIGAVGSLLSLNIGGAISNAISGIESTIRAQTPHMSTSGGNGSFMAYGWEPKLLARFYLPVDDDNSNFGRPLCALRQLSSIPGYILVGNADIEIAATTAENTAVKEYMQAGFYYE